jgi:hypothetical protein
MCINGNGLHRQFMGGSENLKQSAVVSKKSGLANQMGTYSDSCTKKLPKWEKGHRLA